MKYVTQGVSFPDPRLKFAAMERARSLGISFSQYVCSLIAVDVSRGGDFVLRPAIQVDQGVVIEETPTSAAPTQDLVQNWVDGVLSGDLKLRQEHEPDRPSPGLTPPKAAAAGQQSSAPNTSPVSPVHKGISYIGKSEMKPTRQPKKPKGQS